MSRKRRRRLVEMSVVQVSPYLRAEKPLLWLCQKDVTSPTLLPIAVGEFEAAALQMGLGHEEPLRPISYDLLSTMLDRLDVRTRRVVIHSVKDLVFLATVTIEQGTRLHEVDARPSDAVALALRTGAPIFVSDELLEVVGLKTRQDGETVEEAMSRFYDLEPQVIETDSDLAGSLEAEVAVRMGDAPPPEEENAPTAEAAAGAEHCLSAQNKVDVAAHGMAAAGGEPTLPQLRNRLQRAVICEEYEEAAELRDKIQRLVNETDL